jgi:hypothetical protein
MAPILRIGSLSGKLGLEAFHRGQGWFEDGWIRAWLLISRCKYHPPPAVAIASMQMAAHIRLEGGFGGMRKRTWLLSLSSFIA